ncbi:MAG: PDZ domain-containing protein [Crocinitomix sp.]|nr:PDZ domain-containing protein [Crocinitomix sp.]
MKNLKYTLIILGCLFAFNLQAQPELEEQQNADFEILKNLELFELVYKQVDLNYVDEPNPGALMKAAIDAMLYELDPYTTYIPESRIEDYKLMSTGQYGGIGAIIRQQDDKVMVVDPHEGFPAQKAGLMAGDIFLEINGKSVDNLTSSEVSEKLKGKPGTELTVIVDRDGNNITTKLVRAEIKFSPVPYYGMVSEDVGYIKLSSFTKTAAQDVKEAYQDLENKQGMKKLIFDLRGNGGGLVIESVKIVNMFVPQGTEIVSIKGRDTEVNKTYTARERPMALDIPLVVLVDENSASASEIVSGALQDLDRAVIIGQTSFGKGLVQRPLDLKYNAKLKVTIAKYYTPSGRCIQKLDYSNRSVGNNVDEISDSLLNKFKTMNGRTVIDGRGVEPDVRIPDKEYAVLTGTIVLRNILFNYATKYRRTNAEIAEPQVFKVTDEIYQDFSNYVLEQDFEYKTASLQLMQKLEEAAQDEDNYGDAQAEFEALMKKLQPSKENDLVKYKKELIPLLEDELVGRYYYQKGRLMHGLVQDEFILEGIEILNDLARYKKVLNLEN